MIAGILNRQRRNTAYGDRFEIGHVDNLRRRCDISCFEPDADASDAELVTVRTAVGVLGVAPPTIYRLLNEGIIAGEQLTPDAPWHIRLTDDPMARFNGEPADGFVPMREAMRALGISRRPCCSVSSAVNSKQSTLCVGSKNDSGSRS
jgi:predicted DNA-binding transcriptional regulator AlpA